MGCWWTGAAPFPRPDKILSINPATGIASRLGQPFATDLLALAVSRAGVIIVDAVAGGGSDLFTVERATGAPTRVGALGVPNMLGLAFDPSGALHGNALDGRLYDVDLVTGVATAVGRAGQFVRGLAIVPAAGSGTGCVSVSPPLSKVTPSAFFEVGSPAVAVDSGGNTYLAWTEVATDSTSRTYVAKWDGSTSWSQVGAAIARPKFTPGGLAMVLINDQVFIAHGDKDSSTGRFEAVVETWDGSSWVRLGEGFEPFAGGLDLAVDGTGSLVLAWAQGPPMAFQVTVSRRQNGTWSTVGSAARDTTTVANPSLAIDTSSSPQLLVAWDQEVLNNGPSTWLPYVRELPATDLGGSPVGTAVTSGQASPSLVWWNSQPVVAWASLSNSSTLAVDRWSGTTWVQMGAVLPASPAARQHQLIRTSGTPATLAVASVFDFGFGHAAVFEWDETAMAWSKVCSNLVDPVTPTQMANSVTGVALAQDSVGNYLVGAVQVVAGKLFVERVSH